METFRRLYQDKISREIFLVVSHPVASFWRLTTIPKALFLLLSGSYRTSSHQSALSRSRSVKKTVQMAEMSLVPKKKMASTELNRTVTNTYLVLNRLNPFNRTLNSLINS